MQLIQTSNFSWQNATITFDAAKVRRLNWASGLFIPCWPMWPQSRELHIPTSRFYKTSFFDSEISLRAVNFMKFKATMRKIIDFSLFFLEYFDSRMPSLENFEEEHVFEHVFITYAKIRNGILDCRIRRNWNVQIMKKPFLLIVLWCFWVCFSVKLFSEITWNTHNLLRSR